MINDYENTPTVVIDLDALKHNARLVKEVCAPAPLCAVVKADAYGHGICAVAQVVAPFAETLAVASLNEGVKLRFAGIKKPIICLLPVFDLARAHFYDITVCACSLRDARRIIAFPSAVRPHYHLAVNTGMNRLGIDSLSELEEIISECKILGKLPQGIFSHFANTADSSFTAKQYQRFLPFADRLKQVNPTIKAHVSSGGGLFSDGDYRLDMVRVGLMLYGYNHVYKALPLKKVMSVKCNPLLTRNLANGENLLYGGYKTGGGKTSIMAYGYYNGLRKGLDNQQNKCCMNLCAIRSDGKENLLFCDAEVTAEKNSTIVYDILTRVGANCRKIYIGG